MVLAGHKRTAFFSFMSVRGWWDNGIGIGKGKGKGCRAEFLRAHLYPYGGWLCTHANEAPEVAYIYLYARDGWAERRSPYHPTLMNVSMSLFVAELAGTAELLRRCQIPSAKPIICKNSWLQP